ncbi:MAG: helix-turn-helix transcriptional regulator [Mycobacteriales bacterium]
MAEHHFELVIQGELTDARIDALFEAGCDDATFSAKGELITAEFDREGPMLFDVVISSIEAVESVEGLEVLHVAPDELVWASEIAHRTGRTRQSIDQLIKAKRGPGNFPEPATHATRNPLWRWSEVETWLSAYEGRQSDTERSVTLNAINGALQARHSVRSAPEAKRLCKTLQHLLAS